MKIRRMLAILLAVVMLSAFCLPTLSPSAAGSEEPYKLVPVGKHVKTTVALNYATPEALLGEMRRVAAVENYELYIHEVNLVAAVRDTRTGRVTFTNPYNAASDKFYTENIRKSMESQIVLQYADDTGKVSTLWSSTDCANLGQWDMKNVDNGVEITLSLGEEKERLLIPQAIAADRFESRILSHFPEGSRARHRLQDVLYTKTATENGDVYVLRKLNSREKKEVEGYIQKTDYTYEDMDADHAANHVEVKDAFFPNFQLKICYELTPSGLRFRIPADSIRYDKQHFHLISIRALEYFGAVNAAEQHDGYILMPDGSGTLVDFQHREPGRQSLISSQLYNYDCAVTYPQTPRQGRTFHLPVFGIKQDDSALFAIVTKGSGMTTLSAYAGNYAGEYFAAFPTFALTTREKLELEQKVTSHGSSSTAFLYDKNVYTDVYEVEYAFLNGADADYSGMARYYQKYLEKQGMNRQGAAPLSLAVETIGTLNYTDKFLGIPYQAAAKLTTFEQSQEILEHFRKEGITHLSLTLDAWRKGGLEYTLANRLDPASALGGKKDFARLAAWCAEQNIPFYPNADLVFVSQDKWFDGFKANRDTIRLMNDKFGGYMTVRPDLGAYDKTTFSYGLNPRLYGSTLQKLLAAFDRQQISSLGLGTLGTFLNSNFSSKQLINREQNLESIQQMLAEASKEHALQFDGGNAYVLPYASSIRNVPMSSSAYKGTVSVPFLQLVLNGMVPYSSEPINTEYDMQLALLRCIESGTAPHFLLAGDNVRKIKQTAHTEFYSIDASHWLDTVSDSYHMVEKALSGTQGASIVSHTLLADDVARVTWSNGCRIYVNFTDKAVQADGITIPARSYQSVKGETS